MALYTPEQRIVSFFKTLKESCNVPKKFEYKVELSRQAIADMIGFGVETVIRAIKNLERKKVLKIEKRQNLYIINFYPGNENSM